MSAATTPPVTDDNLGNPLGWVYTLPLPPSQGGEVHKFTYGFVSSYSYMTVLYRLKKAEAALAEVKKDRDHYRQKCDLLFQAGFENEECAERAELADLKHDVDRLLTACNEEATGREKAEAELKALTAQEADAIRYRKLRIMNTVPYKDDHGIVQNIIVFWDTPEKLDESIDAAIRGKEGK